MIAVSIALNCLPLLELVFSLPIASALRTTPVPSQTKPVSRTRVAFDMPSAASFAIDSLRMLWPRKLSVVCPLIHWPFGKAFDVPLYVPLPLGCPKSGPLVVFGLPLNVVVPSPNHIPRSQLEIMACEALQKTGLLSQSMLCKPPAPSGAGGGNAEHFGLAGFCDVPFHGWLASHAHASGVTQKPAPPGADNPPSVMTQSEGSRSTAMTAAGQPFMQTAGLGSA